MRLPPRITSARWLAIALALLPLLMLGISSRAATRPPRTYPHGSFRQDCSLCHGSEAWKPARISRKFDHARFGFPLSGAHAATSCTSCHASLDFTRTERLCASCHEDPHRGEMGSDCARCHTARSFIDHSGMLRAHQLTRFPLTGSHASLECESCHRPGAQGHLQFLSAAAECESCHLEDYRNVRTPDHAAGGFPTDCQSCHSTWRWAGARFDHARTTFPLTGAHRAVACASCHGDGVYRGKSADCVSCHRSDYDGTSNPAHAGAGFGTQCATCHNTTRWEDATFDHDGTFFPIHSGTHRNRWNSCTDCHTNPSNYGVFTCLSCHPHSDRTETDGHHRGTSGYQYDSNACYTCHPQGRH
jgi:hypothetical protein